MNNIVKLATAAAAPVVNLPRRGRYPMGVVPLWRGRVMRQDREYREQQKARDIKVLRAQMEVGASMARACREQLAQLQSPSGAD